MELVVILLVLLIYLRIAFALRVWISLRLGKMVPMYCSRDLECVGHLLRKCSVVSSSSWHIWQIGSSSNPIRNLCLFRFACPVIIFVSILASALFILINSLDHKVLILGNNCFVCLQSVLFCHSFRCWSCSHFLISLFIDRWLRGSQGSGPAVIIVLPSFASLSATSFPMWPSWPGIHINLTVLDSESKLSRSLHSLTHMLLVV